VFGGFLVTRRMLEMFKKKDGESAEVGGEAKIMSHERRHAAVPRRSVCFIQALKGLSHPTTSIAATSSAWPAWRSPWSRRPR
jgi:hypothetical protein